MASGCSKGGCTCKVEAGAHIQVEGSGAPSNPLVISADFDFASIDNDTFNLILTGSGTDELPYQLEVEFADTAQLADLPDVSDTAPSNGQVLKWNSGTSLWEPGAPTTASAGSVEHDDSLTGDGSAGTPLAVVANADRFLVSDADGVGISDVGINQLVRHFTNNAARVAADPAPTLGALSTLDTAPGLYDRWTGTAWVPAVDLPVVLNGEFLALSGPYAGSRVVRLIKQVAVITDSDGKAQLLGGADFTGTWGAAAGVLSVVVQPTGTVRFDHLISAQPGFVQLTAFQPASGAVMAAQSVACTVEAVFYL